MPSATLKSSALAATLFILLNNASMAFAASQVSYSLVNSYEGADFFNGMSFWDQEDPTHGFVNYTSAEIAKGAQLAGYIQHPDTNETTAYLGVDSTTKLDPNGVGRASVRISSDATRSNGGLFIADVRHMPAPICGTWPALWLVGPDWPHGGEIDIIEAVNDNHYNSLTLHTGPGCAANNPPKEFLGTRVSENCDVESSDSNTGCSIRANHSESLAPSGRNSKKITKHAASGPGFNKQGGGVYATHWHSEGIEIYMFPHNAVPVDITAGKPKPESWTAKPLAKFGGSGCDYTQAFKKQQLVIDTTFCGEWAGKPEVWGASALCAAKAPTCNAYVANNPKDFEDAYWDIASIKVYQTSEQKAASEGSFAGPAGKAKRHADDFPANLTDVMPPKNTTASHGNETGDCAGMSGTTASASAIIPGSTAGANDVMKRNTTGVFASNGWYARKMAKEEF